MLPPSWSGRVSIMQIAFLLYDKFTALDIIGPYQVLSGLPGAETVFVAEQKGPVTNDVGTLSVNATATLDEVPSPDIIVVPGGPDVTGPMTGKATQDWLRAADLTSTWTTSVCTGALVLAAAGLLKDRRAVTHWLAMDELPTHGVQPVEERVVIDGKYVTGAGVSAGIDMALTLAGKIAGDDSAQAIQLMIEYDPQPPYNAGGPKTAPASLVKMMRTNAAQVLRLRS